MVNQRNIEWTGHGSLRSYLIGYVTSILLTLTSFFLVYEKTLQLWQLIGLILLLALIQAFVQLYFFLDLGREHKPKWNLLVFFFMGMVVTIIVLGSFWIMYNLDERLM